LQLGVVLKVLEGEQEDCTDKSGKQATEHQSEQQCAHPPLTGRIPGWWRVVHNEVAASRVC
jgi:hypothetical protein